MRFNAKMGRSVDLVIFYSVLTATGCSLDWGERPPSDAGDEGQMLPDAEQGGDDAGEPDAGLHQDASMMTMPNGRAVFELGTACLQNSMLGCGGDDSPLSLVCSGNLWAQLNVCPEGKRCDATPGANQGLCLDLLRDCADKVPGQAFCRGNDQIRCGPDRVTEEVEGCPEGSVCQLDQGATKCVPDTDECAQAMDNCDHDPPACFNTLGSFECACPAGYEGDGIGDDGCVDIDECEPGKDVVCGAGATACNNLPGTYTCSCPAGYTGDGLTTGCADIDECASGPVAGCGAGAIGCTNTQGGRTCTCDTGYVATSEGCRAMAWSGAKMLGPAASGQVLGVDLGVDPSGNVTMVWYFDGSSTWPSAWRARFVKASNAWSTPEMFPGSGGLYGSYRPKVAVTGNGNVFVAWTYDIEYTASQVWGSRYVVSSNTWTQPGRIANDLQSSDYPEIVANTRGDVFLGYNQRLDNGSNQSHRIQRWGGGTWEPGAVTTSKTTSDSYFGRLGVDGAGNAIHLFHQDGAWVYARYSVGTNSWAVQKALAGASGGQSVALAVMASGDALAAWSKQTGAVYDIWAARYAAGSDTWGTAVRISDGLSSADHPHLAVDGSGNAVAAWQAWDGAHQNSWINRYNIATNKWGAPVQVSDGTGDAWHQTVAMNSEGVATVVWEQSSAGYGAIYGIRGDTKKWGPTTKLSKDQNPPQSFASPIPVVDSSGAVTVGWGVSGGNCSAWVNRFQ